METPAGQRRRTWSGASRGWWRGLVLVLVGSLGWGGWEAEAEGEPQAEEPGARRTRPPPTERAQLLWKLGERLGAPGARVENPCLDWAGLSCSRTALEPFFASLDALAAGTSGTPAVISTFGNSLIAGDRIVDVVREELGAGFGAAGRGVLLVDRLAPYGPRSRTSAAAEGWEPRTLGELRPAEHPFGITGVYHLSTARRAWGRFHLEGERRGVLWWLDAPKAGQLLVRGGDQVLARPEPTGSGKVLATAFDIPQDAKMLELVAEGRGAVVLGVVLQQARPGIVLDNLGVPSADAHLFLRADEEAFRAQLAERSPALLLFMLGGNEAKRLEWGRADLEQVESSLRELLRRARAAAPDSGCLVVGPIDAVRGKDAKNPLAQRPYLDEVIALERKVALEEQCAFFDLFAAMGGTGSLARFVKVGLVHDDLVHPRGRGLDLLGQLIVDGLLRAWVETPLPADPPPRSQAVESAR